MSSRIEMGEEVKERLKKCGQEVKIYPLVKIVKPECWMSLQHHPFVEKVLCDKIAE